LITVVFESCIVTWPVYMLLHSCRQDACSTSSTIITRANCLTRRELPQQTLIKHQSPFPTPCTNEKPGTLCCLVGTLRCSEELARAASPMGLCNQQGGAKAPKTSSKKTAWHSISIAACAEFPTVAVRSLLALMQVRLQDAVVALVLGRLVSSGLFGLAPP
jgi:hypothetical protein